MNIKDTPPKYANTGIVILKYIHVKFTIKTNDKNVGVYLTILKNNLYKFLFIFGLFINYLKLNPAGPIKGPGLSGSSFSSGSGIGTGSGTVSGTCSPPVVSGTFTLPAPPSSGGNSFTMSLIK
jgi:hypothetical protein